MKHQGHPASGEKSHAKWLAPRLGATIQTLQQAGMSHDEAVQFVASEAVAIGHVEGETWYSLRNAIDTVEGLLAGHAAKWWSMQLIQRANDRIQEVL